MSRRQPRSKFALEIGWEFARFLGIMGFLDYDYDEVGKIFTIRCKDLNAELIFKCEPENIDAVLYDLHLDNKKETLSQ